MNSLVVLFDVLACVEKRGKKQVLLFVKLPYYLTPFLYKLLHSFDPAGLQKVYDFLGELVELFVIAFSQSEQINNRVGIRLFF